VGYVLDPGRATGDEIGRVVAARLGDAIETLDQVIGGEADDVARAVHDVRKRCKESRGAARLVRPELGKEAKRFDRLVRDAARQLSELRDAHALLATFDTLLESTGGDDGRLRSVRDHQLALADAATAAIGGGDERILAARQLLAAAVERAGRWDLGTGFAVLADGLTETYRSGRRGLRDAEKGTTDEAMHEWRKAVKYLWYQMRLLHDAAPSVVGPAIDALDSLGEALGEDHDLAVLVDQLDADPDRFGDSDAVEHARRLARSQQEILRSRAFRAGAAVFAESPSAFRRRMRRLWRAAERQGPELPVGGIAVVSPPPDSADEPDTANDEQDGPIVERERKFLVESLPDDLDPADGVALRQGYLVTGAQTVSGPAVSVRVRDAGREGCTLTVKAGGGTERTEVDLRIARVHFEALWPLTEGARITKTRHRIPMGDLVIELDVFEGDHAGLVVAEVEFDSMAALVSFEPPDWFGDDVSDDERYTNAALARDGLPADHG
jgi:CYTH domain-containing protein/CHAD domain-containing protein